MTDRDRDLEAIRDTYRRYRQEGRARLWDRSNPGYRRMSEERDSQVLRQLQASVGPSADILDLGCGDGSLAETVRRAQVPIGTWTGVDLDPTSVGEAATSIPWATFVEASADRLPFDDATFDLVVASTLFSSLPRGELERAVAAEVARVLRPGGWLVWYDLRYGNPGNRAVHGLGKRDIGHLFPGWATELRPLTLAPPLARRLGSATPVLYRALSAIPLLRTHLTGRLRRPV